MTVIQAIENLLEANWTATVSGRPLDVPQPTFTQEKEDLKEALSTKDVARIVDGGDEQHTPLGFGWTHETIEWTVTIELRTADRRINGTKINGRHRLYGERGAESLNANESGRWPGLVGETQRILLDNRKGFAEFDLAGTDLRVQDQSDLTGVNHYRVDMVVPLTNLADSIDTSV
jgi:hypothetical protein